MLKNFRILIIYPAPEIYVVSEKYSIISSTAKTHRTKKYEVEMWVGSLKAKIKGVFKKKLCS